VDLLRKAVTAGYQNQFDLRSDVGLDPLRQRDDFRKLLADVEEKVKLQAEGPAFRK
jgi:hypothetical protein